MNDECTAAVARELPMDAEADRVITAKKIYCRACEENGVEVCSFENSTAWRDYVDGRIEDSELSERARKELNELRDAFSKYTVVAREEERTSSEDNTRSQRAKLANKIYKRVCSESELNLCFFNGFAAWSDFVHGRIDESELMEKAKSEAAKLLDSKS